MNFEDFLTKKQSVGGYLEYDTNTGICTNNSDDGKDIFEIRYHKCKVLLDFFNKVPNVVQVNLDYLQDNTKDYIDTISKIFGVETKNMFDPIPNHTKNMNSVKNLDHTDIIITDEILKLFLQTETRNLKK